MLYICTLVKKSDGFTAIRFLSKWNLLMQLLHALFQTLSGT
jgi:hypothetical protein